MLASVGDARCGECAGEVVDLGDELVCRTCGVVRDKEVVETGAGNPLQAIDFTGQALGGYLGPPDSGFRERFSPAFAGSSSTYKYLKLISDYSGREDSTVYACAKLIERVAEKLALPNIVVGEAVTIAKRLFGIKRQRRDIPSAAVSAYAIVTACKIAGVTSVNVREIVDAHRLLGRRVKVSALIQLSLDSPFKPQPRRPEDYIGMVLARLSSLPRPVPSLLSAGPNPAAYFAGLRQAAMDALGALGEEERGGHSPCSLAATALYAAEVNLAQREQRRKVLTQRDLAESGNVAEYTVRELYGRLFRHSDLGAASHSSQRPVQVPLLKT